MSTADLQRAARAAETDRQATYLDGQEARIQRVVDVVGEYHDGGRIVEAGASPFVLQLALDQRIDSEVVGLDLHPDRHREFVDAHDLTVRECDLQRDPLPVESADVVVFSEVFEHLVRPLTVLRKLRSALRPGGHLVVTTPNLYRLESWVDWLRGRGFDDAVRQWQKPDDIGHMGHVRMYTRQQVSDFLTAAGFDVVDSQYERFGASDRGGLAGAGLTTLYRAVPWLRPYQSAVATPGDTDG